MNNENSMEFTQYNKEDIFSKEVNPVKVAKLIGLRQKIIFSNDKFYRYDEGYYQETDSRDFRKQIREIIGDKANTYKVNEVISTLKDNNYVSSENLNKTDLLNVKNGMLDIGTFELTKHDPKFYNIVQFDLTFDENAQCPKWIKAVDEIFEGNQIKIRILQEFFGLCFTKVTKHQKALFCLGEGDNGKSTLVEVLQSLLGKRNYSSISIESLDNLHYVANLYGKLVNITVEANAKTTMSDGKFKLIVSGDSIEADYKFQRPFSFKPYCKLIIALNNMPRVDDKSHAFYKRLLILRFERIFGEDEKNINLKDELLEERDGIFLWALRGYQSLSKRGYFLEDKTTKDEVKEYKKDNNNVLVFVEDQCDLCEGLRISKKDLFDKYKAWCIDNGMHSLSLPRFGKELRKQFKLKDGRNSDVRHWLGIDVL